MVALAGTRMLSRHSKVTVLKFKASRGYTRLSGNQPDVAPVIPWLRRQRLQDLPDVMVFTYSSTSGMEAVLGRRPTKHMRTHVKNSVGSGQMAQWLPCWSSKAPSSQHPFRQIKSPLLPSRGIHMFIFCFKPITNGENYDGSHINPEVRNKYDSDSSG